MRTRSHALGRRKGETILLTALAAVALLLAPSLLFGQEAAKEQTSEHVDRDAPIKVTVRNNNWSDVTIYAVSRGTRFRLGTVVTGTAQEFVLPTHLNADIFPIQLLADPIGGARRVVTEELILNPGDEIEWHVQNHLALSGTVISG